MEHGPARKPNRLLRHDYTSAGMYFITICTRQKRKMFWNTDSFQDGLSPAGVVVAQAIAAIPNHYPHVRVETYCVMPNHVHLLLDIPPGNTIALSTIIGQLKRQCSKQLGMELWQKSFHDHVVRNTRDFERIWTYTTYNYQKWNQDCFYE